MVEKIALLAEKPRHIGIFHFKETYRIVYEWLVDQGYDIQEHSYKEIIKSASEKEVDVSWEASKLMSDYFKFLITIKFHPVPMSNEEITDANGVKQKMQKGDFTIELKAFLIKDYKNQWNTPFLQALRRLYDNFLVRNRQEAYEERLIIELQELSEYIKAFWNLAAHR